MARCCVPGCGASTGVDNVKVFSFPASMVLRQKWIEFVGRPAEWHPTYWSRICSRHFVDGQPTPETPLPTVHSDPTAGPIRHYVTPNIPVHESHSTSNTSESQLVLDDSLNLSSSVEVVVSQMSSRKRKNNSEIDHCYLKKLPIHATVKGAEVSFSFSDDASLPLATSSQPSHLLKLYMQRSLLRRRMKLDQVPSSKLRSLALKYLKRAKAALNVARQKFSCQDIAHDNGKTMFYTGFNSYDVFSRIFEHYIKQDALEIALKEINIKADKRSRRLKLEDEYLLVLTKLRLNVPNRMLGDLFGISASHCGRILRVWIPFLSRKFGALVRWINLDARNPPPTAYKDFDLCLAIIDCFELRTERPSNLRDARRSWSEYKHHETQKILIGVSTRGTIMYLSEPWGGRVSDLEIVRQDERFSSILKQEDAGTFVLADKGFHGLAALLPLETGKLLVMPSFIKSRNKLSRKDAEESRIKSNLRINVERTIGELRKFKILKQDYYMSKLYHLNDILRICAGIINLRPSFVKAK